MFANLVANGARSFASGLAGSRAFAAPPVHRVFFSIALLKEELDKQKQLQKGLQEKINYLEKINSSLEANIVEATFKMVKKILYFLDLFIPVAPGLFALKGNGSMVQMK